VASVSQDRSLAELLRRAFTLFGAIVVGAFATTLLAYALSWGWITPELNRGRVTAKAEQAAYAAMLDEENGIGAYLLTRQPNFLRPYTLARVALLKANDALVASVGSASEFADAIIRTRMAEESWHQQWADAAAEVASDGVPPPMERGKDLFDAYRIEQAAFADAIDRRIENLARQERRAIQVRVAWELGVFLLVLGLAVGQHRALRRAIVAPLAALLQDIARVRDGKLEVTVAHEGPRELRELGQGLNDMVEALAAARAIAESRDELVREHATRLRQILDASREFSESLNLRYVVGAVRASTAAVGGYERVVVWLMDDDEKRLLDAGDCEESQHGSASRPSEVTVEIGQGLAGRAAKSGRITLEDPAGQVRFSGSDNGSVRAIAIPLIVGARVVGVLEARHAEPQSATGQVVEVLEMFATHAATAIEAARLHHLTEERGQMDSLTHLFNRRRLDEDLDAECKRCVRYGRPLSFVMLDVDNFKAFNDTHGHPQADVALQEVASIIASAVRTTDTAYRYGGEEFCVLLRETTGRDGMVFAERLRHRIQQRFASGAMAGITASLGVSEFSMNTPTSRELVEAADAAMYESKHGGRNRVMLSSPPPALLPDSGGGECEPAIVS
jgi:diguanylate cyclase (GGDEF)-like protein